MKKRVGILTSGGDCPGLNATIRGVAKALYARMGDSVEIVGILNGYHGLITGDYKEMTEDDFRGILTLGGTILGTKRTPFKLMRVVEEDKIDKVAAMKKTYKDAKLDCLLCLGGNGTHKTANLLSQEGLNIIGLPKTIDNDIYGTDVTFGFHTAVDIATDVIDRIHTTAGSHSRVMCIEIMGNKAGWLTLYSGIAGGADDPTINAIIGGWQQGIAYINDKDGKDVQDIVAYVNSYTDPTTAKELGLTLINKGCDVIGAAAGGSGVGTAQAAAENNCYYVAWDCYYPEVFTGEQLQLGSALSYFEGRQPSTRS
mgnify:CR=1 FL=1